MTSVITAGLLVYIFGFVLLHLTGRAPTDRAARESALLLVGMLVLGSVNLELNILPQKFASEIAFEVHQSGDYLNFFPQFGLQALANFPAFALTDNWFAAIGTNAAVSALAYAITTTRNPAARFLMAAPAVLNFAMFSLRDPFIGFVMMLFVYTLMSERRGFAFAIKLTILAGLALLTRPENLAIMAATVGVLFFVDARTANLRFLALPFLVFCTFISLRIGPQLLGLQGNFAVTEVPLVLTDFFEARASRFSRTDNLNNASAILGGNLRNLPFVPRYVVQLVSFVILPLPHEIRTATMALAFVDSVYVIWAVRKLRNQFDRRALIAVAIFVAATALFSSNYGNAFRLRLPVYFMLAAGLRPTRSRSAAEPTPTASAAPNQAPARPNTGPRRTQGVHR